MRQTWIIAGVVILIVVAAAAGVMLSGQRGGAAADETDAAANLPAVFRPENTPTPTTTPTQAPPTPTQDPGIVPTPPPTRIPNPSPTPGFGANLLANGSFEDRPWTDLPDDPDFPGFLTNQEPLGWELSWLELGETVWDLRTIHPEDPLVGVVSGLAEMLHKEKEGLPPHEWPGQPNALILEGETVYKMFHRGAAFGSQLRQVVSLPPGNYRLTVPVQLHWHENLDPNDPTWDTFTAESGAWVTYGGTRLGNWATAREMGDHRWYYHVIEFTLAAPTDVEVLIRVKSIYWSPKDFFIDAVWLQSIG